MDHLWQDLRFATRTLMRSPALTTVAILTLALGIGANSSVFSLVDAVLFRPLPFVDPDRLVMIYEKAHGFDHGNVSGHEFVAWRKQNRSFDRMAMYSYAGLTLTGHGEPLTVNAQSVTADFFDVLRQRPVLGRAFQTGDDQPDAPPTVVLAHSLWISRFGGDSSVIGRRIDLDDVPHQVIGVMTARGDMDSDAWVPLDIVAEAQRVGKHSNRVIGRLKPGVTIHAAQNDLAGVARGVERDYPGANAGHSVNVASLYEEMVGDVRRPFLIALGAAAFVLLLACANVAHLLLTRAAARQKEFAIRAALGAGRARLARQLVTESLLLSVAGGALALVIAAWLIDLLPSLSAVHIPRVAELSLDRRVVGVTGFLCLCSAFFCGMIPALRASAPRLKLWMGDGTRATGGPGRRLAGLLVVSEVAIALMLLIGAGLTVKSFANLMRIDPGFDSRNVLTVALPLPGLRYPGAEKQRNAVNQVVENLAHAPGVEFVGATTALPLGPCCNGMGITIEGKPTPAAGQEIKANMAITTGSYFQALHIPLRRGRLFNASDARVSVPLIRWFAQQPPPPQFNEPQPAPVAVISETMAKQFWPDEPVIGKRLRVLFSPWITVVGVVGDVRQSALVEPPTPQMYLSSLQEPNASLTLLVRAAHAASVAPVVRQQIRALDKELPIGAMEMMDRTVWNSIGRPRFNALLLGASSAIALLLAVIGVYGVIAYSVQRRTHEIGIRRALGAQTRDVLRLVLGHALSLVLVGVLIGVFGAIALTRLLTTLLYGVAPTDPATFVSVAVLLTGVALLACYVPSQRATRVDPTDALRAE
jgi:putative ABC transport system permease protein